MIEILLGIIVLFASFALLAIGVIANNKPITGSCGGLANLEDGASCEICGRTTDKCSN
ncbi:MAG: (Na+)-NQR maturation NqrM [SAR86 cluster bacterium]|uniref:(Na+)-NQR maturation NqrM n=1 Tax=SAR86 cluster bacterium TaxID=2030880 RepID=A0A520M667_9GAMM|nr:MAG: (Na+)-NQR maturation NqrM [SAR86 cluster bacterium]